jgi:hypothetical protein
MEGGLRADTVGCVTATALHRPVQGLRARAGQLERELQEVMEKLHVVSCAREGQRGLRAVELNTPGCVAWEPQAGFLPRSVAMP